MLVGPCDKGQALANGADMVGVVAVEARRDGTSRQLECSRASCDLDRLEVEARRQRRTDQLFDFRDDLREEFRCEAPFLAAPAAGAALACSLA